MPRKITKAIIPVAGLGTRFFPITKSIPKEMLPIVDKPCIQYVVEEAVASGIKEIIFVISKDKPAIKEYFSPNPKLEKTLKERGKLEELKKIKSVEKLAKFHFVYQTKPLGDGHAILFAKKFLKNEPALILFGDDIIDHKIPAARQLINEYNKSGSPIIALEKIAKKDSKKYGIAGIKSRKGRLIEVSELVEKPEPKNAPSDLAIIGKYIITPEVFKALDNSSSHTKDGEIRLIDGFKTYMTKSPKNKVYGYEVEGQRFDTGNLAGYLGAVKKFGKM